MPGVDHSSADMPSGLLGVQSRLHLTGRLDNRGYEICSQIHRIALFKGTSIVVLTSNNGIVEWVRAKVAGSSGFLSKPVDADKVLTVVRKHLGTVDRS